MPIYAALIIQAAVFAIMAIVFAFAKDSADYYGVGGEIYFWAGWGSFAVAVLSAIAAAWAGALA